MCRDSECTFYKSEPDGENKESVKTIDRATATRLLGLCDCHTSVSGLERKSDLLSLSLLPKSQYHPKPTEYNKRERNIDGPEDIEVTIHDRSAILCVPIEKWHCQNGLPIISEFWDSVRKVK